MEYVKEGMALIPSCENCKSYEYTFQTNREYCRKFEDAHPSLCLDWSPAKSSMRKAAHCRIEYLRKLKEKSENQG